MVDVLHVHAMGWTQTLESSVTSAAGVDGGRRIQLDYPVTNVTGVFNNGAGTGINYWTMTGSWRSDDPRLKNRAVRIEAKYIVLAEGTGLAASTAAWVTYDVPSAIRPIYGAYGSTGRVSLVDAYSSVAGPHTFTTEMTDKNTGSPEVVTIEPQSGGMVVKSVKVVTDGADIDMYIYSAGGSEAYADSYAETNQDTDQIVGNATINAAGQSFTGNGNDIIEAEFYLKKILSPTGNATCKIYASTGSDPNRTPTGAALATSNTFDVSTLTGSYALITFTFPTPYTSVNGTTYFVVLDYTGGNATNYVHMGTDTSSPNHASNNFATYTTSWSDVATADGCFYVTTTGTADDPADSLILWKKETINGIYIENQTWVIDASITSIYVGYVDNGTATAASTNIELRGTPLV